MSERALITTAVEGRPPADLVWQPSVHVPQLDGVRGLAILIVTLYRFGRDMPTDSIVGKVLAANLIVGERGVELFFLLSGFLITGILIDAKRKSNYFVNFFARRGLRIFPLYFGALFLFLCVIPWLMPSHHPFAQAQERQFYLWSYLSNVRMCMEDAWCFGGLDHFWSLAVEEHFYFVWPFVIYYFGIRSSLWIAVGVACLAAGGRVACAAVGWSDVAPSVLTVFRCDALLLGAILAIAFRRDSHMVRWRTVTWWAFGLLMVSGLCLDYSARRWFTVGMTVWPLAWACLLILLATSTRKSTLAWFFDRGWLRNLGRYSYGMYIFQSPLIPLAAPLLAWLSLSQVTGNAVVGHLAGMALLFGLTYLLAWLSWHAYEKHFLELKRWFSADRLPAREGGCGGLAGRLPMSKMPL